MPTLEAPSGLVLDVRKIRGRELIKLAEQANNEGPDAGFASILSGCFIGTVDAGPYAWLSEGESTPDWQRILKGDILFAFIFLRRISLPDGDTYDFDVKCEDCRHRYGWTIDLAKNLPVQRLPEASAAKLRAGESFEAKLTDGRTVRFALQTQSQEAPIQRLLRSQKRQTTTIVETIAAQTLSIEGVGPDLRARWRFVSDLDMDDLMNLRAAMDAVDCGVDTAIQTRCTKAACGWVQDINLPLGKTFFALRRRPKPEVETDDDEAVGPTSPADSSAASASNGPGASSTTSSGPSTEVPATL